MKDSSTLFHPSKRENKTMLQPFRNIIIMSAGYVFAVGSILIMYTLLPVIFFEIRGATWAGVAIMLMTMLQILLF